ncbi:hypothetical protein ACFP81_07780 [Deinococcus lacus]|uniref:Uncharacterized protein n=1 Tax=Deinococcus lacus TaxID=392561 RepID=A0ABW1YC99_9DEIO
MRPLTAGLALVLLSPTASALNPQVAPFIPAHHKVVEGKATDLDGDGLSDRVLVLEDSADPDGARTLLVLMGTRQGFRLGAEGSGVVLCRECGGVRGDPLESIEAGRGWFRINHMGGSNWIWSKQMTFSLRDGGWTLAALHEAMSSPARDVKQYSIPPAECQNTDLTQFVCGLSGPVEAVVASNRAFFYAAPSASSRTGKYVIAGQQVTVYTTYRTFVEAEYVDERGRSTWGFLRRADLRD